MYLKDTSPEGVLALLSSLTSKNENDSDKIPATITSEKSPFSTIADTNEGMFRIADPMYTEENGNVPYSYYWRGAVTNNWFKYGGHMWRIIRINGDGTLRLMYTGTILDDDENTMENVTVQNNGSYASGTGTAIAVGTDDNGTYRGYYYATSGAAYNDPSYSGWTYTLYQLRPSGDGTPSYAKNRIENWMSDPTKGNLDGDTNIVSGKFCVDRSTKTKLTIGGSQTDNTTWTSTTKPSSTFYYGAYQRLYNSDSPSLGCGTYGTTGSYNKSDADIYNDRYGLITADEVVLAGGRYNRSSGDYNKKFYIYNEQCQWTVSPCSWNGGSADVFYVASGGNLGGSNVDSANGLRPVINLSTDNLTIEGSGLYNNPFTPRSE